MFCAARRESPLSATFAGPIPDAMLQEDQKRREIQDQKGRKARVDSKEGYFKVNLNRFFRGARGISAKS